MQNGIPRGIALMRSVLILASSGVLAMGCETADPAAPPQPITIVTETLTEAIEGRPYTQPLEAEGDADGYTWVLAAGSLPAGLTLSPSGMISGTPAGAGTADFRIRATGTGGQSAAADLSLLVVQRLAVHTWMLPDADVGEVFAAQVQSVGGRGTLDWSLSGEAASWLTVSPSGALSGTPGESGATTVTVTVADESGQEASRQLGITVRAPLAIADIELPGATQGRACAAQLVASGGRGAYTWTTPEGALPAGMSLTAGGALAGTPGEAGTFTFTVQVTDAAGRIARRSLSLIVASAPTIQTGSLPAADVGMAYQVQLAATGGTGAHTWSLVDGALPAGLTLSPAGLLAGAPTTIGSSSFTVLVTDESGRSHARSFTLVVARVEPLTHGVAVTGIGGGEGSIRYFAIEVPAGTTRLTVATSGGTGDVDLYLRRGDLPQEFAYDCRPLRTGNGETCTVPAPAADSWFVMLRGHTAFADVRLEATLEP